ncbi:MAG TPA: hypothetical protein VF178_17290 [Gemmatimonadaceae bacterium]
MRAQDRLQTAHERRQDVDFGAPDEAQRGWPYFLALLTGFALIGLAIWPGDWLGSSSSDLQTRRTDVLWLLQASTGVVAIIAVFVARRPQRRPAARLLLVLGAVALLAALLLFRAFSTRPLLMLVVPAIALLVTAFAMGRVPGGDDPRRAPVG